ncbi:MAG: fused MFS/spermidine synthase [Dehalococcoidia bacterium]|nr:fused MFS/spermidine synthase [Dehalococcoidia bacterium]
MNENASRHRLPLLWKANIVVFLSSFCVMVIELVAARILAPHIGVSLYTWTSIIGVILAGIAIGNYLGGKVADKFPSPFILMVIFLVGGLLTAAVIPFVKLIGGSNLFYSLPVMWDFLLKAAGIFLLPALVLSMVSPLVIKLTLADVGKTGGVVGTIYAFSTAGSILGTFLTGFYLILWFGTGLIVWLVSAALLAIGVIAWFLWRSPGKMSGAAKWVWVLTVCIAVVIYGILFLYRGYWQTKLVRESNYYAIKVEDFLDGTKGLVLDNLVHGYVDLKNPTNLKYGYERVFAEMVQYITRGDDHFQALHLGGGSYTFPRYLKALYPGSRNEVVEIDPAVTQVAHEYLGLAIDTEIITHNRDARLFLIQRDAGHKFDFVVGDVFNDRSTPYHLTTLEFDRLVKKHMKDDGVYMINIIDDYRNGEYMPAFIRTLKQVFKNVYVFTTGGEWKVAWVSTFVIVATDRNIDLADYVNVVVGGEEWRLTGQPHDEGTLEAWLIARNPILLTDDHVPTDIFVAPLFGR